MPFPAAGVNTTPETRLPIPDARRLIWLPLLAVRRDNRHSGNPQSARPLLPDGAWLEANCTLCARGHLLDAVGGTCYIQTGEVCFACYVR